MLTLYRYGLIILFLAVIALLVTPIMIFVNDILRDPHCLSVEFDEESLEYVDENYIKARIIVTYCSSIPLKDFNIYIGNTSIHIGDLSKDTSKIEKMVVIPLSDLEKGLTKLELYVAGLYKFRIEMVK